MLIPRIKEYLTVGLAVVAVLALAAAAFTHYRNQSLTESLETATQNNKILVGVNEGNAQTIRNLTLQREIDDELLTMLRGQYEQLAKDSEAVHKELEGLKSANPEFNEVLNTVHPVDVGRLLNDRASGDEGGDSKAKTPK